jgi:predicted enzyme related to lactoylglutathione lyase
MKLARIILFVPNVTDVAEFYQKHFGMTPNPGGSDEWTEMAGEGGNIALHKARGGPHPGAQSPVKICFYCADIDSAKESFAANGLTFGKTHEFGNLRFADATDPAGNPIQISNR